MNSGIKSPNFRLTFDTHEVWNIYFYLKDKYGNYVYDCVGYIDEEEEDYKQTKLVLKKTDLCNFKTRREAREALENYLAETGENKNDFFINKCFEPNIASMRYVNDVLGISLTKNEYEEMNNYLNSQYANWLEQTCACYLHKLGKL